MIVHLQEKRLRLELEESTGRARCRVEGLSRGLEQAKAELVSLLNAKVVPAWICTRESRRLGGGRTIFLDNVREGFPQLTHTVCELLRI